MKKSKFLEEYPGLQIHELEDLEGIDGGEELNTKVVSRNKDGLLLLEYDNPIIGSLISIETVCDLFPDFNVDINKGYMLQLGDTIITE